tara:strand:+ start:70 stop:294 length:225 start_codon:yes stop_codon:yes gene_type:complete
MKSINKILKSQTGKKMIASLSLSKDLDKSILSEYIWINELPLKQQELFDTIYQLLRYSRVELAFILINKKPILL